MNNPPQNTPVSYTPSRRDYFAAAALQGLLAGCVLECIDEKIPSVHLSMAEEAVDFADALIAELDKTEP